MKVYLGRLGWIARDALPRFKGDVFLIVAANFLGLVTAAMSLGGVIMYARQAESGEPLRVLGWTIELDGGVRTLLLYGGACAVLGVFSGLSLYYTEWRIGRVTRAYERLCQQRVLAIAGEPIYRGWQDIVDLPSQPMLSRLLGSGSRFTAFALRDMLRAILPIATFIFTLSILFVIDRWLTLLLFPLAAAYAVPLYLINQRVARTQVAYRQQSALVRGRMRRAVRAKLAGDDAPIDAADAAEDSPVGGSSYERMMELFYSRILADKRALLLNTTFFVVCLFVLFVYFGLAAKWYDQPWTDLISYLVALRFAISALRQTSALFVKVSRFFPEYRGYTTFVQGAEAIRTRRERIAAPDKPLPNAITFAIGPEAMWDSAKTLTMKSGAILWVLVPSSPSVSELEAIASRMEDISAEPVDFASRAAIFHEGGTKYGVDQPLGKVFTSAVAVFSSDADEAEIDPHPISLFHEGGYVLWVETDVEYVVENLPIIPPEKGGGVVVMDERRVRGMGDADWLRRNADSIRRHFQALQANDEIEPDDDLDSEDDPDSTA